MSALSCVGMLPHSPEKKIEYLERIAQESGLSFKYIVYLYVIVHRFDEVEFMRDLKQNEHLDEPLYFMQELFKVKPTVAEPPDQMEVYDWIMDSLGVTEECPLDFPVTIFSKKYTEQIYKEIDQLNPPDEQPAEPSAEPPAKRVRFEQDAPRISTRLQEKSKLMTAEKAATIVHNEADEEDAIAFLLDYTSGSDSGLTDGSSMGYNLTGGSVSSSSDPNA